MARYIAKNLVAASICEQVEDPRLSKGIVKREVVEVLSPGTALSERYLVQNDDYIYIKENTLLDNRSSYSVPK